MHTERLLALAVKRKLPKEDESLLDSVISGLKKYEEALDVLQYMVPLVCELLGIKLKSTNLVGQARELLIALRDMQAKKSKPKKLASLADADDDKAQA